MLAPDFGLEVVWEMTPRQLAAHARLRKWQKEEELAAMGEIFRLAQHADKDAFAKVINQMRS